MNLLYERFQLTKDRLQSTFNLQDAKWRLIRKWYENDSMETDCDVSDKGDRSTNRKTDSTYFSRIRDKLNKGTLNPKNNEYLNQLAFVQKRGYSNKEREINPGASVPAPANPTGNIISSFKYANTNDTLPKCSSIEQFNKEIDEKAQYMLNNPNGNTRKRNFYEAFELCQDEYNEPVEDYASKYDKYNDHASKKRRKVISDDEEESDNQNIKLNTQNDQVDISRFIKKSDIPIPDAPKKEPTPVWTKKNDFVSPSKEDNSYKLYKENPIERIAGGFNSQYNTFQNREMQRPPNNDRGDNNQYNSVRNYNQSEPEFNDQNFNQSRNYKDKRAGSAKLSECDDDYFYKNKPQNPNNKNSMTGDRYIDDANAGKGFVSAEKQLRLKIIIIFI